MPLRHSLADLKEMTHHVAYEHRGLWSFLYVDIALMSSDEEATHKAQMMQQARLEAGLIHLRVLADFLMGKRDDRYKLGLVADDYFDDGWLERPNVVIGKDTNEQHEILSDLHARLAHLSLRRLDATTVHRGFSWEAVMALAPKVIAAFASFVGDLAKVHPDRAAWFAEQIPRDALVIFMRRPPGSPPAGDSRD